MIFSIQLNTYAKQLKSTHKGTNMIKTAAVSGLHIRMDVPTKCRIVEAILTKSFPTKKEQNQFIDALASQNFVNPITIKLWCGKYQNTWKFGKLLPDGTMSFAFATVPANRIEYTVKELYSMRKRLRELSLNIQTKYHSTLTSTNIEETRIPSAILDKLILNKKV